MSCLINISLFQLKLASNPLQKYFPCDMGRSTDEALNCILTQFQTANRNYLPICELILEQTEGADSLQQFGAYLTRLEINSILKASGQI
jgi:hypothetical protein